jgi:hypothetical protein
LADKSVFAASGERKKGAYYVCADKRRNRGFFCGLVVSGLTFARIPFLDNMPEALL